MHTIYKRQKLKTEKETRNIKEGKKKKWGGGVTKIITIIFI